MDFLIAYLQIMFGVFAAILITVVVAMFMAWAVIRIHEFFMGEM